MNSRKIKMPISDDLKEKIGISDKCIVMIYLLDTVVFARVEKMFFSAIKYAREEGVYQREVKRDLNEIKKIIDRRRLSNAGNAIECYLDILNEMLPQSKVRFNTYGMRPEDYLLSVFVRRSGKVLQTTEDDFEVMIARNGFSHAKLLAALSMIYGLCFKTLDIHDAQYHLLMQSYSASELMLTNGGGLWKYVETRINNSRANEPLLKRIITLSSSVMKRLSIDREWVNDIAYEQQMESSIVAMRSILSGEELNELTDKTLTQMAMDYTEFYLACLRMDMLEDGKVDKHYRKTLSRYVGEERVDELLDELSRVEPMREEEDLIGLQQRLPDGSEESAIRKFRNAVMKISSS